MCRLSGRSTSWAALQIGIPVRIADERHAEVLGRAGEQDRAMPDLAAAVDLGHGGVDVPEGRRHHRNEAARIGRDPLDQPVVVGAHAGEHELGIVQPEEGLAAEASDVGVERHRPGADPVHVREARLRVVGGGRTLVQVPRNRRERLRPARHRRGADRDLPRPASELPDVDAVVRAQHARRRVLELPGQARGPDVARLGDVGVGVDEPVSALHRLVSSGRIGPEAWDRQVRAHVLPDQLDRHSDLDARPGRRRPRSRSCAGRPRRPGR